MSDDVLPSLSDGSQLFERAMKYVMEFLLRHFPSLKNLKSIVHQESPSKPQEKSTIIPMAVLQKYTEETIKILNNINECDLKGDPQINVTQTYNVYTCNM